jgi:hypothetical protein
VGKITKRTLKATAPQLTGQFTRKWAGPPLPSLPKFRLAEIEANVPDRPRPPGLSRAFGNHAAMNGTSSERPFRSAPCHQRSCQWCILLERPTFEPVGASAVNPWVPTASVPSPSVHAARPWPGGTVCIRFYSFEGQHASRRDHRIGAHQLHR